MSEAMIPRRALLSVSDKTGLVDLARALQRRGVQLLSTGGTANALRAAGLDVTDVSAFTGAPEIMDGRVKTLHPKVHGGLLAREAIDAAIMAEHGIAPIDLLVVNLYPFAATIATAGVTDAEAIEQIDIGGPAMLRAGAKNHDRVAVLCEPTDYAAFVAALESGGSDLALRRRLAAKVYAHTARYDGMIAEWLGARAEGAADGGHAPTLHLSLVRKATLRYGENPHQSAALYVEPGAPTDVVATAEVLGGKELSYNNLADAEAALECVRQFARPASVIVKHANPCGVAEGDDLLQAYDRAYATDPVSAFGGIIAFNRTLDAATAAEIVQRQFVEVVLAPDLDEGARAALATKPNVRVLRTGPLAAPGQTRDLKRLRGGLLVQDMDTDTLSVADLKVVTKRAPSARELEDLLFAWKVAFFVKSNAIVYARDGRTIGVGAGQMSRVVSARIAAWKAGEAGLDVAGSAMASDAFFPFRDGIDAAAAAGIRAVIQPGGSMRDKEVIAAADDHGMAMVFTGRRHFRH